MDLGHRDGALVSPEVDGSWARGGPGRVGASEIDRGSSSHWVKPPPVG